MRTIQELLDKYKPINDNDLLKYISELIDVDITNGTIVKIKDRIDSNSNNIISYDINIPVNSKYNLSIRLSKQKDGLFTVPMFSCYRIGDCLYSMDAQSDIEKVMKYIAEND